MKVRHAGRLRARIAACAVIPFLLFLVMLVVPASSSAAVAIGVSVSFGPPALPVYVQPPCPGPGYIWTPGYWAWDPAYGYYWVPGTWVAAPFVGALWTPGYWGFGGGLYYWHPGYWGTLVGYYGGIDYGFGYPGFGYRGGYWNHDRFFYNRAVNNIRTTNITNVYYQNIRNVRGTRISYNGGPGGINARPTPAQLAAARYRRFGPVGQQMEQERFARANPVQRATMNRGRPAIAATPRPGMFRGNQVVRASSAGAPYREPPRTAFRGGRTQYSAPARVERAPAVNAPRYSSPRGRVERPAPQQNRPQPPAYRREAPSSYRPAPNRGRPPEARQFARRAAPERPAQPSRPERGGGGNHGRGPHR
ncbi:MAG: hypothetical protein M1404_05575 [Acidobacteria bacterium]|nr:hypothetical protein [Acidobacteriota bacterium]